MNRALPLLACALGLALAAPARADLSVGAGTTFAFPDGTVDLDCTDLVVAGTAQGGSATVVNIRNLVIQSGGTLQAGASTLSLGGDFSNGGSFSAGSGSVKIVDACGSGVSRISGANSFHDLDVATSTGKQLVLPAGETQTVTHALTLQGAAGQLLQLDSSTPGTQAVLAVAPAATQQLRYVDAQDNRAGDAPIAPGTPASRQSVDGGNLSGWFGAGAGDGQAVTPIPTLGEWGLMLLGLLAAGLGARRLRRGV